MQGGTPQQGRAGCTVALLWACLLNAISTHSYLSYCTCKCTSAAMPPLTCVAVQTGKMLLEEKVHEDAIQDFQISADHSHGVTASLDKTAKLVDIETFEVLKTYRTGRLVQSAAISPIFDHVSV